MSKEIVQKNEESIQSELKDSNYSSVGEAQDGPQEEQSPKATSVRTETLVIDGISIQLNYSDKKNDHVLDNIKKTLIKACPLSKKMS